MDAHVKESLIKQQVRLHEGNFANMVHFRDIQDQFMHPAPLPPSFAHLFLLFFLDGLERTTSSC